MLNLLSFFFCIFCIAAANTQPLEESIKKAAQAGLTVFLDKIPPGHESKYGFKNREQFQRAKPGTPIQVSTVDADAIRLVPMDEWRVPVLVDGKWSSLLTVVKIDNDFKTVEIGGAALAREMAAFRKGHPAGKQGLLRLHKLKCDLMILDEMYYPLQSAGRIFGNRPYSSKELLDKSRSARP